jgi:hypothetical protein
LIPGAGDADTLTLYADYTQPRQQAFPTTAAGFNTLGGSPTGSHSWLCDEASGNLVDEIGGEALVPENSPLHDRRAVGFFDGTDTYSKAAVEVEKDTSQRVKSADMAFLDRDETESIAIAVDICIPQTAGTGLKQIVGKYNGGTGVGYTILASSAGTVVLRVEGGVTRTIALSGLSDGARHRVVMVIDRAAQELRGYDDVNGAATPVDISTVGTLSNTIDFGIGAHSSGFSAAPAMVSWLGVCLDAEAEKVTGLGTSWSHATDPGGDTALHPALSTYTRNSVTACPIGDDPAYGLRIAKYGSGQFAHRYDADYSHATKLDMAGSDARTNLLAGSEALHDTDWADIGTPTVTANAMEAADGSQTLTTIAASGAAEGRDQTITVNAETEYTFQIFNAMRGIPGTDAFAEVEIYDADNAATIDTLQIDRDTDDLNAAEELTFTTPTGCTSVEVRVRVDDGSTMGLGMVQVVLGKPTTYIPSPVGAAGTRVITTPRLTNTGGDTIITADRGEIEIVCSLDSDASTPARTLINIDDGATNNGRIRLQVTNVGTIAVLIWDSAGTIRQNFQAADPGNWDQLHTIRLRWDTAAGVAGNAENCDLIVDGVRTAGAVQTWTMGSGLTLAALGINRNADAENGGIAHVKAWSTPRPESV